jgi:hypothetical protein
MKELHLSLSEISTISENVDKYVEWWCSIGTILNKAESSVNSLRPGKDKLRVKSLQRIWTGLKDDYMHYESQVCCRTFLNEFISYSTNLFSRSFNYESISLPKSTLHSPLDICSGQYFKYSSFTSPPLRVHLMYTRRIQ